MNNAIELIDMASSRVEMLSEMIGYFGYDVITEVTGRKVSIKHLRLFRTH